MIMRPKIKTIQANRRILNTIARIALFSFLSNCSRHDPSRIVVQA